MPSAPVETTESWAEPKRGSPIALSPCVCGIPHQMPAPLPLPNAGARRVVQRRLACACKREIQLATREGWERWYRIAWYEPGDATQHTDTDKLPGRKRFLDRLAADGVSPPAADDHGPPGRKPPADHGPPPGRKPPADTPR